MSIPKVEKSISMREIYRNSSQRISLVLTMFGIPKQDSLPEFHLPQDRETISNLLNSVVSAQKFEPENEYKIAILEVGGWVYYAYMTDFLNDNSGHRPNPMYVIKKGIEVLHMLLHRDLRRKQLSPTESQVFNDFLRLAKAMPNPRQGVSLNQNEIDKFIDLLPSRKSS
jgi:hypothetical protein